MRIHHKLPDEDIIEHSESMECLCEPYVEQVVDLEDGSVVVVQHKTFEGTKPKQRPWPYGPFGGYFGGSA